MRTPPPEASKDYDTQSEGETSIGTSHKEDRLYTQARPCETHSTCLVQDSQLKCKSHDCKCSTVCTAVQINNTSVVCVCSCYALLEASWWRFSSSSWCKVSGRYSGSTGTQSSGQSCAPSRSGAAKTGWCSTAYPCCSRTGKPLLKEAITDREGYSIFIGSFIKEELELGHTVA